MLSLTVVLGLGLLGAQTYQRDRYVNRLSQEIRQLDATLHDAGREPCERLLRRVVEERLQ